MKFKKVIIIGVTFLGLVSISGISNANASRYGWWQTRSERRMHNNWVRGQVEWSESHGYMKRSHHRHHHPHYIIANRHHKRHYNSYNDGYVNRTNKKHLLHKSGYSYNGELYGKHSPLDYRSYMPKHFKLKKGMLWNISPDYEIQYEYEGHGNWDIVHGE